MANTVEDVLQEHNSDYEPEDLYVHIPSTGKARGPHVELEGDFSHTEIPRDLNRALMDLVDVADEQPATKHHLLDVLEE